MWVDPWLLDTMFLERMADAHRDAANRRLLRLAEPDRAQGRGRAFVHRLFHLAFVSRVRTKAESVPALDDLTIRGARAGRS
jgi:hypothetical protein